MVMKRKVCREREWCETKSQDVKREVCKNMWKAKYQVCVGCERLVDELLRILLSFKKGFC